MSMPSGLLNPAALFNAASQLPAPVQTPEVSTPILYLRSSELEKLGYGPPEKTLGEGVSGVNYLYKYTGNDKSRKGKYFAFKFLKNKTEENEKEFLAEAARLEKLTSLQRPEQATNPLVLTGNAMAVGSEIAIVTPYIGLYVDQNGKPHDLGNVEVFYQTFTQMPDIVTDDNRFNAIRVAMTDDRLLMASVLTKKMLLVTEEYHHRGALIHCDFANRNCNPVAVFNAENRLETTYVVGTDVGSSLDANRGKAAAAYPTNKVPIYILDQAALKGTVSFKTDLYSVKMNLFELIAIEMNRSHESMYALPLGENSPGTSWVNRRVKLDDESALKIYFGNACNLLKSCDFQTQQRVGLLLNSYKSYLTSFAPELDPMKLDKAEQTHRNQCDFNYFQQYLRQKVLAFYISVPDYSQYRKLSNSIRLLMNMGMDFENAPADILKLKGLCEMVLKGNITETKVLLLNDIKDFFKIEITEIAEAKKQAIFFQQEPLSDAQLGDIHFMLQDKKMHDALLPVMANIIMQKLILQKEPLRPVQLTFIDSMFADKEMRDAIYNFRDSSDGERNGKDYFFFSKDIPAVLSRLNEYYSSSDHKINTVLDRFLPPSMTSVAQIKKELSAFSDGEKANFFARIQSFNSKDIQTKALNLLLYEYTAGSHEWTKRAVENIFMHYGSDGRGANLLFELMTNPDIKNGKELLQFSISMIHKNEILLPQCYSYIQKLAILESCSLGLNPPYEDLCGFSHLMNAQLEAVGHFSDAFRSNILHMHEYDDLQNPNYRTRLKSHFDEMKKNLQITPEMVTQHLVSLLLAPGCSASNQSIILNKLLADPESANIIFSKSIDNRERYYDLLCRTLSSADSLKLRERYSLHGEIDVFLKAVDSNKSIELMHALLKKDANIPHVVAALNSLEPTEVAKILNKIDKVDASKLAAFSGAESRSKPLDIQALVLALNTSRYFGNGKAIFEALGERKPDVLQHADLDKRKYKDVDPIKPAPLPSNTSTPSRRP